MDGQGCLRTVSAMEFTRLPYPGHCLVCKASLPAGSLVSLSALGATCETCVREFHQSQGTPGGVRRRFLLGRRDVRESVEQRTGQLLESTPRKGWGILHNCRMDQVHRVSHLVVNVDHLVAVDVQTTKTPLELAQGRLKEGGTDHTHWLEEARANAQALHSLTRAAGGHVGELPIRSVLVVGGGGLSFPPCTLRGIDVLDVSGTPTLVTTLAERSLHVFLGQLVCPT